MSLNPINRVYLGRGESRRMLRLGKPLGEGASGKVFAVADMPGTAAKLYHGPDEARRYEAKIEAMLAQPPELPPALHAGTRYPQIAWPTAKLHDAAGNFTGFLMPEIDFARSTSLVNLLQKNSRKLEGISDYYGYRVLVARNLASVFAELHRAGHHMIDMKPANLRFYPAVSWMAVVDADGFSIAGTRGRIAAAQLSDEYIAPESWQRRPAELGLEQDLFALAAIIFQLLNNGAHPFAGTAAAGGATDLQTRILEGLYPYAVDARPGLTPSTASIHRMFRRQTREMFDAAFLTRNRPSAAEWRDHLHGLVGQLTPCSVRPGEHVHFGCGCGFCAHEARVEAVRTALPRRVAVRRLAPRAPQAMPPLRHMAGRRTTIPRRGPSIARAMLSGIVGAAILGGTAVASDQVWQQMLARKAYAATLPIPAPGFGGRIGPLAEPGDYLILPPRGARTVALREGPGEQYPALAQARMRDDLLGSGISVADDGAVWVLVTRGDSTSGFVPRSALIERDAVVAPFECPLGKTCVDSAVVASERAIGERYRELLGRSGYAARARLDAGQRAWEQQRQACGAHVAPAPCRLQANAARAAALDDLGAPGSGI